MNLKVLSICGTLGALLFLGSCAGTDKKAADAKTDVSGIELESYEYDVIAEVTDIDSVSDVDGSKYCHVTGQGMLPKKIGGNDITTLRDSLMKLGAVTFASDREAGPALEKDMKLTEKDPSVTEACGSNYHQLNIVLANPRVIVWKSFAGGYICRAAHGNYTTTYLNYDVESGNLLSVADLMKPGYEEGLLRLIRQRLLENKVDLIVSLGDVKIPSDFRITDSGLQFVYGLYEIAPYASGEITVDFEGYELQDLLKPQAMELIYGPSAS